MQASTIYAKHLAGLIVGLALMGCVALQPPANNVRLLPDQVTQGRVSTAYGKLPLSFEINQGQTDAQVKFLSRGRSYTLILTSTEALLVLRKTQGKPSAVSHQLERTDSTDPKLGTQNSQLETVVRMKLVGASPEPKVVGLDELPGKVNYFIGNDRTKWRTNIPTYAKVKYQEVYPGVDLVFYGNQQQLEYDFIVAPGADPKTITLAFEAAQKLRINDQGDLVLQIEGGEIRLHKPVVYQKIDGVRKEVSGSYVLNPKSKIANPKSKTVGFEVAAYDLYRPLIIDPVLSYSTYLGGGVGDRGFGIAVDSSGNAYMTGSTESTDFPTANALHPALRGAQDVFVTKLNPEGSALVYSTYLGGGGSDGGQGIAVDTLHFHGIVVGHPLAGLRPVRLRCEAAFFPLLEGLRGSGGWRDA